MISLALTRNQVRGQIADEEAQELANGVASPHEITQGVFLNLGLELEEQQ